VREKESEDGAGGGRKERETVRWRVEMAPEAGTRKRVTDGWRQGCEEGSKGLSDGEIDA